MFDGQAEEAINLYRPLFQGFRMIHIDRYGTGEPGAEGSVKRAGFQLGSQKLIAIDSPAKYEFSLTPCFSLFIECESAEELEQSFESLSAGGSVLMPPDE